MEVEREEFLLRLTGAKEKAAAAPRLQYYNKVTKGTRSLNNILLDYLLNVVGCSCPTNPFKHSLDAPVWNEIFYL